MIKVYFKKINMFQESCRKKSLKSVSFRTHNKSTLILPFFMFKNIEVYNGKKYIPININKWKIGFFLKDFLYDRNHSIKNNKKEFNIKIVK